MLKTSMVNQVTKVLFGYDFFISYSHRDGKTYAKNLERDLEAIDCVAFRDESEHGQGSFLDAWLKFSIRRSSAIIVVGTDGALESPHVTREIENARSWKKQLLPVDATGIRSRTRWPGFEEELVWIEDPNAGVSCPASPSPEVIGLLSAKLQHDRKNRWTRRLLGATALTVVGLALFAWWQWSVAVRQSRKALARQTAAQSEVLRDKPGHLEVASLLALESLRAWSLPENHGAIGAALAITATPIAKFDLQHIPSKLALSPERNWFATATYDGVYLWNGGRIHALESTRHAEGVKVSPDGTLLAVVYGDDLEIVSLTGHLVRRFDVSTPRSIIIAAEFSPNGKRLVTVETGPKAENNTAFIWDLETGHQITALKHKAVIRDLAMTPDSQMLLSTTDNDKSIHVWDTSTGNEKIQFPHAEPISTFALSGDGKLLLTSSFDRNVQLWDFATGKKRLTVVHPAFAYKVAIGRTGSWFATATNPTIGLSFDETAVRIWDSSTGKERMRRESQQPVACLTVSPDEHFLASTEGSTVHVWDAFSGHEKSRFEHDDDVTDVAFGGGNAWIATASRDFSVRVWSPTGREIRHFVDLSKVNSLSVSGNGRWIASAGGTLANVRLLDDSSAITLQHPSEVRAVVLSADGASLATATTNTIHLWQQLPSQQHEQIPVPDGGTIHSLSMSSDARIVAASTSNSITYVWDTATLREHARIKHRSTAMSVALSPDGRLALSGSADRTAILLDTTTGRQIASLPHEDPVILVALSPDGKWIATATEQELFIWDRKTLRQSRRILQESVASFLEISPNSKWISVVGRDKAVRIWDLVSGEQYVRLDFDSPPAAALFTPDSRQLLIATGNRITIEPWLGDDMEKLLCKRLSGNLTTDEWKQYLPDVRYNLTCPGLPPRTPVKMQAPVVFVE